MNPLSKIFGKIFGTGEGDGVDEYFTSATAIYEKLMAVIEILLGFTLL